MSHDHHSGHAHGAPHAAMAAATADEHAAHDARSRRTTHDDGTTHDKHAGHSVAMFRDRFWISLVLTIPTLIWEPMIQSGSATMRRFSGSQFMQPVFGAVVFLYGGWVFIEGAWRELRDRLPGMMTLISLAISVAFLYSVAVTLGLAGHPSGGN